MVIGCAQVCQLLGKETQKQHRFASCIVINIEHTSKFASRLLDTHFICRIGNDLKRCVKIHIALISFKYAIYIRMLDDWNIVSNSKAHWLELLGASLKCMQTIRIILWSECIFFRLVRASFDLSVRLIVFCHLRYKIVEWKSLNNSKIITFQVTPALCQLELVIEPTMFVFDWEWTL